MSRFPLSRAFAVLRSQAFTLAVVGVTLALGAGGCSNDGEYEIRWQFAQLPLDSDPPLPPRDPSVACGAHGVDGVMVTGTGAGKTTATAVCADGGLVRSAAPGNWSFLVQTVDVLGNVIQTGSVDPTTEMREITE